MKKACIDTNILGWYYHGTAKKRRDKENVERAMFLFDWMGKNNVNVVIPAIVLAEMLCDIKEEEKREEASIFLSSNFEVVQYDVWCAREFATLRVEYEEKNKDKFMHVGNTPKCKLINDYNICASAIANGCDAIFTNNTRDFLKFSNDRIPILSLEYVNEIKRQEEETKRQQQEEEKIKNFGRIQFPEEDEQKERPPETEGGR